METYLFFISLILSFFTCQAVVESIVHWYEKLPAVAMDYKVKIDPGKEDCYYQFVNPGATFYASFQVRCCFSLD